MTSCRVFSTIKKIAKSRKLKVRYGGLEMKSNEKFYCKIYGRGGQIDGAFADKISRSDYNNVHVVFNGFQYLLFALRDK